MNNLGLKNLDFSKHFIEALFSDKMISNVSIFCEKLSITINDEIIPLIQDDKVLIYQKLKKIFPISFFSLRFFNGSFSFVGEDICIVYLRYYLTENYSMQVTFVWKKIEEDWKIGAINFYYDTQLDDIDNKLLTISPRLQNLYKGMQAGILRCDFESLQISNATDFFYKKFNLSRDDLEKIFNNNLLLLINPQDRVTFQQIIRGLTIGECFEFVTTFLINDSSIFVFITGELLEKNGQKYLDILVTNSALIKRKKEKLQKAAKEINFIYNSIPSVVFRCSFTKEGIISFANKAFYDFIGYSEEEFLITFNNSFNKIMVQDDSIFVWNTISKNILIDEDKPILVETRIITKDNIIKHLVLRARLMYREDGVPYLYCVGNDRTEIYQYEEDLQHAKQKLEIAVSHLNISFWEYDPRTGKAFITRFEKGKARQEEISNFVSFVLDKDLVDPDYYELFKDLHDRLNKGASYAEANILLLQGEHQERVWKKFRYSTIFDSNKKPMLCIGTSEDINAYMEIKNKLAIATKQTGIIIWTYNIQTNEISIENDAITSFTLKSNEKNYPEKRIESGKIYQEDIEIYRQFYNDIHAGIPSGSCEIRIFDYKKQDFTWVKLNYTLMLDYKNEPDFALGTIVDISEIKKAEAQYKEQVQLWEIAQHNTFGSLVFNVDTKKVIKSRLGELNDVANKDIDIELVRFKQFILKKDQQEQFEKMVDLENIISNYKNGIFVSSCIFQGRFYNQPMWLECEMKVMKHYETGQLLAFLSLRDITNITVKSKFAEVCVLYQIDLIFQIDLKNDTYIYWAENNTLDKEIADGLVGLYSYDAPRILSHYVVEEDRDRIIYEMSLSKIVARSLEGNSFEIGCRFVRGRNEQDEIRYKRFHVFMYDEILQTICVGCMDITELYLEEQRRNDELYHALENTRQANRTKSSFLASMSHDLRTPMNGIIGMTNLALSNLNDQKQIKESLEIIKSSSDHLLNLLNDILEMAKIESGKISYFKSVFSIKEVTQKVCDVFKVLIKQKNIIFNLSFADIIHEFVESDETRYQRIISNIISNAIKFTPQNGSVSVIVKEVITIRNNIAQFIVIVKDTGIGIAQDQLPYIFDPFHRVESSMISKIEGTGLGLAIVKALVDGLGGSIKVDSELGIGSSFTLELPFVVEKKKNIVEDANNIEKFQLYCFNDVSALLVEDHPINIVVIKKMLEKLGMKITITKNGKEGAETFIRSDKNMFDIIFMDLQMPVLNGYDATIVIRESNHPRAKTIPIVAMTANTFEEDVKKCFEVGMNGHIAKPVVSENLIKTLLTLGIRYTMKDREIPCQNCQK